MQITINQIDLLSALTLLKPILTKKTPMPILQNVKIEASGDVVTFSGTDLETGIVIKRKAIIAEEGATTLPGTKLLEITKTLTKGSVTLKHEKGMVVLSNGNTSISIPEMTVDNYPNFMEDTAVLTPTNRLNLINCLELTIFSASKSDSRFGLSGVYIGSYENSTCLVATDGHRLSLIKTGDEMLPTSSIIPRLSAIAMSKALSALDCEDVMMGGDKKNIIVKTEDVTLTTRLLDSEYPDFTRVIPAEDNTKTEVNVASFLQSLKRVLPITSDTSHGVEVTITKDEIELVTRNGVDGEGTDRFKTESTSTPTDMFIVNINYLIESLSHVPTPTVRISVEGEGKPIVMLPPDRSGEWTILVMPMRK
jgi:DNA polymerase-3 subunit beta